MFTFLESPAGIRIPGESFLLLMLGLSHFVSCGVLGSSNTFWVGNVSIHYYSIHNPLLG